jgi:hypothetical protein
VRPSADPTRSHRPFGLRNLAIPFVAVALGLTGCDSEPDPPSSPNAPPDDPVAVIGDHTISTAELDRHVRFTRRTYQQDEPPPDAHLQREALDKLLLQAAIAQEAAKRGIHVSKRRELAMLADTKKRYGPKGFKDLIGPFKESDFAGQLLSAELAIRLGKSVASSGGDPQRYLDRLPDRWRARTTCEPGYRTGNCGGS